VLFVLVLISLINIYIFERYKFAYLYRKPPTIGNNLNAGALEILSAAPIFMLLFGFWILGNNEMFFNRKTPMESLNLDSKTKHTFFE
jgi:hypothetical protein